MKPKISSDSGSGPIPIATQIQSIIQYAINGVMINMIAPNGIKRLSGMPIIPTKQKNMTSPVTKYPAINIF